MYIKDEQVKVFKDNDHATFLLYESASFKKANVEDAEAVIRELRDGGLYSCWAAVQQGLHNLNVLETIKDNSDLMKSFFCYTLASYPLHPGADDSVAVTTHCS